MALTVEELLKADREHLIHPLHHPADHVDPFICARGHGVTVEDVAGRQYIDGLSGLWNVNGTNLENYGVPPDVYIDNTPADFAQGRDAQIEKAVEVLKEELRNAPRGR